MCACTETDMRESAKDCTLASGEGHSSHGEMFHQFCAASSVSSSVEHSVYVFVHIHQRVDCMYVHTIVEEELIFFHKSLI
jgi:hypothetical protein